MRISKPGSFKIFTNLNRTFLLFLIFTFSCCKTPIDEARWQINLDLLASITVQSWAHGSEANICVEGNRVFIGQGYPGMVVFDISSPESPRQLLHLPSSFFPRGGQPGAIAASGTRIFVATPTNDSIHLMDMSNLNQPMILESFGNIPDIKQLLIRGSFLFVSCGSSVAYDGGIYVYNISGDTPVLAGTYLTDLIDPGFFVTQSGVVFFARSPASINDPTKIEVVDMSDPSSPVQLGLWTSDYPGNITDIYLEENTLYCSAYWGGLWALDVKDYANITMINRFDWSETAPYASSVRASPPFSFIAASGNSQAYWKFVIFRHEEETISVEQEISSTKPPQWTYIQDDLLFLIEKDPGWPNPSAQNQYQNKEMNTDGFKIINIYRIKKRLE